MHTTAKSLCKLAEPLWPAAPAQASDLLSLSAQTMCLCYVGNIQNVICLMILECRQVIFKTLSALLWFLPSLGQCCMPAHTRQIVWGVPRPPPAAGRWTFCVGSSWPDTSCLIPLLTGSTQSSCMGLLLLCHWQDRSFSLSTAQVTGILSVCLMALD